MSKRIDSTIVVCKADPIVSDKEIPNTRIDIIQEQLRYATLEDTETHYENQSELIENALFCSLPQGVYDRLIVRFMKRKVSLYRGITS